MTKDDLKDFFIQPTMEKLRFILENNDIEDENIEFKQKWIEDYKIAKTILAIANSGCGLIIFSV